MTSNVVEFPPERIRPEDDGGPQYICHGDCRYGRCAVSGTDLCAAVDGWTPTTTRGRRTEDLP